MPPSQTCTTATVLSSLNNTQPKTYAECCELLLGWMQDYDRGAECDTQTQLNDMHVVGMGLCAVFDNANLPELHQYDFDSEMGDFKDRIAVYDETIACMSWQNLQDVVSTVQIEFNDMFTNTETQSYMCIIDISKLIVVLMARIGFYLQRKWRDLQHDNSNPTEATIEDMRGSFVKDIEGWCTVRDDSVVHILDGIHAIATSSLALLSAEHIATPMEDEDNSAITLYNHHREASLDDFYELSQIADTPLGAVSQYKHKFRHLFHSTSQVVYFHYPSYVRRKQIPLPSLQAHGAEAVALLPLLMQVQPEMKVLHEHTGAGFKAMHNRSGWHWTVVGNRILLTNQDMKHFDADDLRTLLLYAQQQDATA